MPYIKPEAREKFDNVISYVGLSCDTEGELNYLLTKICLNYLDKIGSKSYAHLNTIIGVLECCKQEMYRRVVAGYENLKCDENGDVYCHEVPSTS